MKAIDRLKRWGQFVLFTLVLLTVGFYLVTAFCAKRLYNPTELVYLPITTLRIFSYWDSPRCREGRLYFWDALFRPVSNDSLEIDGITHNYALPPFTAFVSKTDYERKEYFTLSRRYVLSGGDERRNKAYGWTFEDAFSTMNVFSNAHYLLHMNISWQDNKCISSLWVGVSNRTSSRSNTK